MDLSAQHPHKRDMEHETTQLQPGPGSLAVGHLSSAPAVTGPLFLPTWVMSCPACTFACIVKPRTVWCVLDSLPSPFFNTVPPSAWVSMAPAWGQLLVSVGVCQGCLTKRLRLHGLQHGNVVFHSSRGCESQMEVSRVGPSEDARENLSRACLPVF